MPDAPRRQLLQLRRDLAVPYSFGDSNRRIRIGLCLKDELP